VCFFLISEKTNGLTKTEKEHVVKTFKDRKFEEVDGKIDDYIKVLKEGVNKVTKKKKVVLENTKKKTVNKLFTEDDGLEAPKKEVVKDEDINKSTELSMNEIANSYIF